jgi:hypothetical protein
MYIRTSLGKYLFKTKCRGKNKDKGDTTPMKVAGSQNIRWEIGLRVEIVRER